MSLPCYKSFNTHFRLKSQIFGKSVFCYLCSLCFANTLFDSILASFNYLWFLDLHAISHSVNLQYHSICVKYTFFVLLTSTKPPRFRYPVQEVFLDSLQCFLLYVSILHNAHFYYSTSFIIQCNFNFQFVCLAKWTETFMRAGTIISIICISLALSMCTVNAPLIKHVFAYISKCFYPLGFFTLFLQCLAQST